MFVYFFYFYWTNSKPFTIARSNRTHRQSCRPKLHHVFSETTRIWKSNFQRQVEILPNRLRVKLYTFLAEFAKQTSTNFFLTTPIVAQCSSTIERDRELWQQRCGTNFSKFTFGWQIEASHQFRVRRTRSNCETNAGEPRAAIVAPSYSLIRSTPNGENETNNLRNFDD